MNVTLEWTMTSFEAMRIFAEVVKSGNFTTAAKNLGISKQLVSRRVMELEASLGTRLLNRTTRKLAPTELGKIFYERCLRIIQDITEAEQEITNRSGELRGLLRLSAPVSFASMVLSPVINSFMGIHPKLEVVVDVNNHVVDVSENYDVAIKITRQPDPGLMSRWLTHFPQICCCSPAYADRYGIPQTPSQLTGHRCITQHANEWIFEKHGQMENLQIHPVMRSNHGEVMREAAIAGLGITLLPAFYVEEALNRNALVPILQDYAIDPVPVYALYPQHRQSSVTVRTFIEYLQQWFETL